MLRYYKEKNFIVAYNDTMTNPNRGKWDITTGAYYGVRGTIVKGIPKAFDGDFLYEMHRDTDVNHPILPEHIYCALKLYDYFKGHGYTRVIANRLEQVISLGLSVDVSSYTWRFLAQDTTPLTKDVVAYLKDVHDGTYSQYTLGQYKFVVQHKAFFDRLPNKYRAYGIEALTEFFNYISPDQYEDDDEAFPAFRNDTYDYNQHIEAVKTMICYAVSEHVYHTKTANTLAYILFLMVKNMLIIGHKVEPKRNILTNDVYYHSLRKDYEEEHYDDILRDFADAKWLYYENDDYIVRPLISRQQFHEEAEAQHNCVERIYLRCVRMGETHIVSIRKKSDPDHSYITCEVNNSHEIEQYLLECNRHITEEADKRFYDEYQKYLQSSR